MTRLADQPYRDIAQEMTDRDGRHRDVTANPPVGKNLGKTILFFTIAAYKSAENCSHHDGRVIGHLPPEALAISELVRDAKR